MASRRPSPDHQPTAAGTAHDGRRTRPAAGDPAAGTLGRADRGIPAPLVWPELHHPTADRGRSGQLYYSLALLRSQLVHGVLICARAAADAAVQGRLPGGPGLRLVPLSDNYNPSLQLLAGIFARKGERQRYDDTHPLNLLWNAFNAHTQHRPT
jgi:hypothetical protein